MNTRMDETTSLASKLPAIPIWMIAAVLAAFVGLVFWSVLINDGYANIWGLEIGHHPGAEQADDLQERLTKIETRIDQTKDEASPLIVDYGIVLKNGITSRVKFNRTFSKAPTVLVSSYWKAKGHGVQYEPTVIDITDKSFTVVSKSEDPTYHISWVAFE